MERKYQNLGVIWGHISENAPPPGLHEAPSSLASALNSKMGEDFVISLSVLTYGS